MISFELHLEKWHEKTQKPLWFLGFPNRYLFRFAMLVAGVGLEPHDLRVMSPTSYQLLYPAIYDWCRRPGSNRYDTRVSQDFKSRASACSATPARSLTTGNIIPHLASVVKTFLKYFQRTADMAKLGLLCLQNGTWNGQQVISPDWLKEMLSPRRIESGTFSGMSYGYLWWIVHSERNVYAAIGDGGNVIYVDPNKKVVVAVSAYFKPAVHDRIDFIENILLPAINKSTLF